MAVDCEASPVPAECRPVRASARGRAPESPDEPIAHPFADLGWTGFERVRITDDSGVGGPQVHTATVTAAGRGRLTGARALDGSAGGNAREWLLRENTRWLDSEIRGLWWGPSVWAASPTNRPQMGFVHRAVPIGGGYWVGLVSWMNIFLSATSGDINRNAWRGNGTTEALGQGNGGNTGYLGYLNRAATVIGTSYVNFAGSHIITYKLTPPKANRIPVGTLVTITGMSHADYNLANVAVSASNPGDGNIQVIRAAGAPAVTTSQSGGTVTPAVPFDASPYWVASQCRGGYDAVPLTLRTKVWAYGEAEPEWGGPETQSSTITASATVPVLPAEPGLCGLVAAHAHSGSFMEYGDPLFRRLPRAA